MAEFVDYKLEYFDFNGKQKLRYIVEANPGTGTGDNRWKIYRFDYIIRVDGRFKISEIKVLTGVAWDNRVSLAW